MSFNFGSTVTNDFSTFSDDEKLNYALKLALNRVQTWGKTPWYEEPSVLTSTLPNLTLKNKIPPGSEIETYYLVDPDLGKATDRNVLKAIGSNDYNTLTINTIDGSTYASNPPIRSKNGTETISVTNNGETKTLLKGISKTMIAKYVYWQNKLTGKVTKSDGTGTTTNTTSGTGTYPDKTAPFASFMTLSNVQNDYYVNDRRVSTMKEGGSYSTLYDTLESYYSGLEIIHWSNIDADGTAPPSKRHPFFKVFIGLPTYSTYSDALKTNFNNIGVSSSQSGDNIGFTNKLLEGAMGSINGYKFYLSTWNKKTQQFKQKKEDTYGDANNLNILYFLSYSGFILNYGEKNILDGKGTSIDDTSISIKYPPTISFVKYTGETFSDGIISQGDTLPAVEVSNDKDLFINTSDNTIHRLDDDNGTKTWVRIGYGGSSGGDIYDNSDPPPDNGGSSGSSDSTITKEGQVLEMLSGICDGRSIIGNSGTYTLQSVTAPLYLTSIYQDVTGSEISYKPPEGTRYVIYSFKYYLTFDANSEAYANSGIQLLIDDIVQVEPELVGIKRHSDQYVSVNFTIEINGETNSNNITLNEWTTHKTLKLQGRERNSTRTGILHMGNIYTREIGGGGNIVTNNGQHSGGTLKKPTLSITAIGQSTITTGGGGSDGGTTITRKGQLLEILSGISDGRTVTVESGTYQFDNVTTHQDATTTFTDITGSSVTYKPPPGTKQVIYNCQVYVGRHDSAGIHTFKYFIDDVEVYSPGAIGSSQNYGRIVNLQLIIDIGDTTDDTSVKFASWSDYKTIKLKGCELDSNHEVRYHSPVWIGTESGKTTDVNHIIRPQITVRAIGESTTTSGGGSGGGSTITRKGQVLEVLLGRAESGESVEVETGVYTFPLNTNYDNTKLDTSYQKVDSSQLTYTAPEGTERFFYEYRMRGGYDNPTGVTLIYQLYINDIAFGNEEQVATYQQRNMVLIQSIITKSDLESSGININSSLNIYYKMKTNTGVYTLLEWDESATKRLDDYIKVTAIGERTSSGGGGSTVTKKGQTLETLIGVFDGRTVEVESGTYTLKNVTQTLDYDNKAWLDLPNTDIDYKPPAGTKQVYIRYTVAIDDVGYRKRPSWRLAIDGEIYEEQAIIEQLDNNDENYASETKNRSFVLHINGTNDIANGFLESWNTLKKIKLQVASRGGRQVYNQTRTYSEATGQTGLKLLKPSIKIVAIGESNITTGGGGGSGGGGSATNVKSKMIKDYKRYENVPNIVYSDIPKDNYSDALNIPELDISITPNLNNSLINVRWVINFESESNTTFKVVRFIGSDGYVIANNSTAEESGVATSSYDNNDGHTPHQLTLEVFDEPKVTSEVIYKIYIVGAANDNNTRWFALNGSGTQDNDTGTNYNFDEKLISSVFAIEYDQHNVGGGGSTGGSSSLWNVSASNDSISYSNGNVGIGTNDPQAGLHVTTVAPTYLNSGINDDTVTFLSDWTTAITTFDFNSSSSSNHIVSIIGKGLIYGQSYVGASDQRIKKNIFEVDDDKALQKLRDISCCWYNYIDHLKRGKQRTIGFIAQQVKEQLPEAVQTLQDFIPNKMKFITDASWNNTTMLSNELLDVSGIKYKFYVSNDLSGNDKEIDLIGQNDNSFVFDQSYNYIFCYGKEVDDFHTLDKQKLFTLNFSATQEIDRIQQKQLIDISQNKINIETLKIENADLKNQINIIKHENEELKTELNIIKLQNQTLQDRLEAIEKRLYDANI